MPRTRQSSGWQTAPSLIGKCVRSAMLRVSYERSRAIRKSIRTCETRSGHRAIDRVVGAILRRSHRSDKCAPIAPAIRQRVFGYIFIALDSESHRLATHYLGRTAVEQSFLPRGMPANAVPRSHRASITHR